MKTRTQQKLERLERRLQQVEEQLLMRPSIQDAVVIERNASGQTLLKYRELARTLGSEAFTDLIHETEALLHCKNPFTVDMLHADPATCIVLRCETWSREQDQHASAFLDSLYRYRTREVAK